MICPKCGKKLLDGHMYCEDCGCEINLVPEFEAMVEESMAESIQGIVDKADFHATQEVAPAPKKKKGDKLFMISGILITVLVFLLVTAAICSATVWKKSTFVQEMLVEYYIDDGDYEKAIAYLEETLQRAPEKTSLRFRLCGIYLGIGQEEKALEAYKVIAANGQYTFEEQIAAVEQIVAYYKEKEDYESISSYLNTVKDENIKMAFLEYMVTPAEFSQPEGAYTSLITLKLSSDSIGTIHYTMDGSTPTVSSPTFQGTLFLEAGENIISAIVVNEYGVSSQVVTKRYFIESKQVTPPEVLTYSGVYTCPVKVQLEKDYNTQVYYTTDGTAPNRNSNLFTGDVYLPLGKSVFKFVAVNPKGEVSEVVTRDYQVQLDTDLTTNDARDLLVDYFVQQGLATDGSGHVVQDDTHILVYEYLYPMSLQVGQDCYYFAEVLRDTATGEQQRTGAYYGVDIRSREIYNLTQ